MAENLPIHMSNDDKEEIVDNESVVSKLSDKEEEIEYDSASEPSLDSNFNEDDKFQAPLVVPLQDTFLLVMRIYWLFQLIDQSC